MENWVGARIKNLRKAKGITQEELAELCNVSPSCVSRWETGSLYPRRDHLRVLAKVLGVTPEEILNISNTPISNSDTVMEYVFLLEKLEKSEQEFFLRHLQSYFELKQQKCPKNGKP